MVDFSESIRMNYDKPLSLRLQWILKEMKEKSRVIGYQSAIIIKNSVLIDELKLNLTDDFDDYPTDNEFDYSDYAYEDSIDGSTTMSSTTLQSSSISLYDDSSIDDMNTVSYYDYGEQDVYTDDELDDTSTQKLFSISTTTVVRIPSFHQRQPVIWNINIDNNDDFNQPNSSSSLYSSYLFLVFIFILT
jgi:hypothetical protein